MCSRRDRKDKRKGRERLKLIRNFKEDEKQRKIKKTVRRETGVRMNLKEHCNETNLLVLLFNYST